MVGEVLGKGKTYSIRLGESGSCESREDDCVTHCEEYMCVLGVIKDVWYECGMWNAFRLSLYEEL